MEECPLDWKRVFKEILGDKKKFDDKTTSSSEQCSNEHSSTLLNFKTSESCSPNTLQSKHSFTSKRTENELLKTKARQFEKKIPNSIGLETKQKYDVFSQDKVPEWNKAFKDIISPPPPVNNDQDNKNFNSPLKFKSAKDSPPVRSKKYYTKKKSCLASKSEMAEEIKVRNFFASSSVLLKPEISCQSLNDYAGTGVDIFKYDKKLTYTLSEREVESKNDYLTEYKKQTDLMVDILKSDNGIKFSSKSQRKVHFEDDCTAEEYIKPDLPSVWVAKMKPLTSADILAAPVIQFDEPAWDEDLLYY